MQKKGSQIEDVTEDEEEDHILESIAISLKRIADNSDRFLDLLDNQKDKQ